MTKRPRPRTDRERSANRYARAARVLGGITLDREHAAALDAITKASGETAAAWVRRMIREQVESL